jgi:hypothetical protein
MNKPIVILLLLAANCFLMRAQETAGFCFKKTKALVDTISSVLNKEYISVDLARKMNAFIYARLDSGKYNGFKNSEALGNQLTEDLRSISHDKHLTIFVDYQRMREESKKKKTAQTMEIATAESKWLQERNYGFTELKILDGNIGYLNLKNFDATTYAGETAAAAMCFLNCTKAIIIDLRENSGGSPNMIQLLISYFYKDQPIHINDFYVRSTNETKQIWTLPYVPGKKLDRQPLYILTSLHTFSAAEGFSYCLKNLNRATIVGETTGGAAHPCFTMAVSDSFSITIPNTIVIDPLTHTDWEGTGVKPDVTVIADRALLKTQLLILEKLMKEEKENTLYKWLYIKFKCLDQPFHASKELIRTYVGNYDDNIIFWEQDKLYYQDPDFPKTELHVMEKDLLSFEGADFVRIQIIRENGKVVGLMFLHPNENSPVYNKLIKCVEF